MAGRGNPISFKTNVNRNKTQKWQQAKTYNYDGDDWGGYDPYDEYAYDDAPPPPMPQQQQQPPSQQYGQPMGYGRPPSRKHSFDQEDERRNFSAGPVMYGAGSRSSGSPARSNVSGGEYNDGRPRSRPRDFTNPEQVPPPLAMRGSPGPAGFPPRKSSVSSGSPAPEVAPMPAKKEEKELPIPPMIRPSDIYKRMEAEREKERQSQEGSRPSMDSLQKEAQQQGRPLSSVQEDFGEPAGKSAGAPMLPSMRNMIDIGTSFLHGSSEAEKTTRAPAGKDPAAEILAERTDTRARPGTDPASEILAERTSTRAQPGADPAAEILAERSATRAMPGSDPAADILAERGHNQSIDEPESGVEHHYRSMVDQAFDYDSAQNSASLSRDSSVYSQSVGGAGVSRNSSNATSGISPIMSRVPSAATAKMQQLERERQVPTIAEEPSQRATPNHSRNVSAGSSELIHPGYRRSLDPPSGDNSPARSPGMENTHSRRLSQPMSAETGTVEPPAVTDQGVEMMPALEPGGTPASEAPTPAPLPSTGRSRAGTDYSMRESDIAREASTSPDKNEFSASIAQAANAEQTAFLQDHASTPTSQWAPPPASGRSSPAKSRVREIAGKYQNIDAESRRGSTTSSKSSWSNFRGSNEDLPGLKKRPTGESGLGSEIGQTTSETRPGMASQMSFRPDLPGQWIETPAPVLEKPVSRTVAPEPTLQSTLKDEEAPDFSPTTDKRQLSGHSPSLSQKSQQEGFLSQAKGVGEALGASLMSTVGVGHQTRDFASKEPPAPVEQPRSHKPTGEMGHFSTPDRPDLMRGDTGASMATDIASSASDVPPTPPAKEGGAAPSAQPGQASRLRQLQGEPRPISNYFSGAVAPLQPTKGHSREASADLDLPKLGPMTNMSTATREDDMESDRLRREIVRSLSPTTSRQDDAALTQDALDAPDNMRKVESGQAPEPPAESTERSGLGLLNQRFSWEDRADTKGVLDSSPAAARTRDVPTVREPEADPEIKPEMPYERPRSRGLHIMNAEADDSSDDEKRIRQQTPQRMLDPGEKGIVSLFTPSQENLRDGLDSRDVSRDNMAADAPNPVPMGSDLEVVDSRDSGGGSGTRVPSYYTQGQPDGLGLPKSPSLTQQSPVPEPTSPSSPRTAIPDRSPTSPTAPTSTTEHPASASKPRIATISTGTSSSKIPPFREILANKDATKRMDLYTSTRQTFADTNTGLASWLEGMLEQNPEYANLGTRLQPSASSLGTINRSGVSGHKHSPSLAKFKQLGSSFAEGGGGVAGMRRLSTTREVSGGSSSATAAAAGGGGGAGAPAPPPKDAVWEQRGKDLMKGAGVLGGKAQAGAKGLLMKGRSRFGTKRDSGSGGVGDKALPPVPSTSTLRSSRTSTPPPPPDPPTRSHHSSSTAPTQPQSDQSSSPALPQPNRANTGTSRYTDSLLVPATTLSTSASTSASTSGSQPSSRAPSQAPSHSRAPSRPQSALSRTWSRLRERRSGSQSGSRSRSRPGSLVVATNAGQGSMLELGRLENASPVAVRSVPTDAARVVQNAGQQRRADVISPWNEPGDYVFFTDTTAAGGGSERQRDDAISPWDEPDVHPFQGVQQRTDAERLGVLPSPTATAFSTVREDSQTQTARSRQGSAVSGWSVPASGRGRQGSRVGEEVIPEDDQAATHEGVHAEAQENPKVVKSEQVDTYEELQRGWGTDSEAESADGKATAAVRPEYARLESARAFLPSQLKGSSAQQSPRSPRSPRGLGREQEDELYESTPRQTHFPRVAGDDDEEEERTPVAVGAGDGQFPGRGSVDDDRDDEGGGEGSPSSKVARENSGFDVAGLRDTDLPDKISTTNAQGVQPQEISHRSSTAATPVNSRLPANEWDKRSAISSEDNFEDANEGNDTDRSQRPLSRRSSVSSMGHAATEEPESTQVGPVGGVDDMQQSQIQPEMVETTQQHQPFMNQSYRSASERPMSYMPLGTTSTGQPMQESLPGDDSRPESASIDLSGMGGPPAGVQPYQKHLAMRDPEAGLQGDHGGLRSPPPAPDANPIAAVLPRSRPATQSRQVSAEGKDRSSRRFSGFFRSRRPSQAATTAEVYGPAPSAISDQYGLENLPTGPAATARPVTQASEAKRRSGVWDSFKRSSVVLVDDSRQSSVAALPSRTDVSAIVPQQSRGAQLPQTNNALRKPQRATTSATPPDPAKKKRFSGFGSLFGRSSTTGHKTERPRKLVKQNANREASQTHLPATSSVTTGYEAYEEARRRQAKQKSRPKSPDIGLPQQERVDLTTAAINFPHGPDGNVGAPADGWYGPGQEVAMSQQQEQPSYRMLHSERERVDLPLDNVPEAYRPVHASYGRAAPPIGPPSPPDEAMPRQTFSPPLGQRPYSGDPYPAAGSQRPAQRHASQGSNEYQLSPQVSGRSEYTRQEYGAHGSSPSISPIHSRAGSESFSRPRQVRVGSIPQEMARGPPAQQQVYGDQQQQQRPWAIGMPPAGGNGGQRRSVSSPAWPSQSPGGDDDYYPPQEDYRYAQGPYPAMSMPKQRMSGPQYPPAPRMQQGQGPYPSSPQYSPGSMPYQQRSGLYSYQSGPPPGQQRFYSQPGYHYGAADGFQRPRQYSSGPPMQQRPPSGYIGRRDEPAFGEESLEAQMRGSSYPGQEWAPGRWD